MKIFFCSFLVFFSWFTIGHTQERRILFLGDSLTEGYGVGKEKSYPTLIEKKLKAENKVPIHIINAGESGSKSSSALPRLRWQLQQKPSILVLALGANDGLQGVNPTLMESNLDQTIQLALDHRMKVLLVGMKMPFNYGEDYRKKFEQAYDHLIKKYGKKIVWHPFLLKDIAGKKELNLPDGIHPNEKGHEMMASSLLKTLKPML
jgi:acyl-CoA thioesterase-1